MNRAKLIFIIFGIIFISAATANAGVYNFQPNPVDLYGLDHYQYYLWNINWAPPSGETITGASLSLRQIYDVNNYGEVWNRLAMHLMNNTSRAGLNHVGSNAYSTTWQALDNSDPSDAWDGTPLIANYSDPNPVNGINNTPYPVDLLYNFDATLLNYLNAYSADGNFDLGFDPDCHYFNQGITLTITTGTTVIPEPATLSLLGLGLLGMLRFKKKTVVIR